MKRCGAAIPEEFTPCGGPQQDSDIVQTRTASLCVRGRRPQLAGRGADRGFVSFADDGELLASPVAHRPSLQRMGVAVDRRVDVGTFRPEPARFLEFRRDAVVVRSAVAR